MSHDIGSLLNGTALRNIGRDSKEIGSWRMIRVDEILSGI
jgi:hypothetical protein